jgi:WXG100 family type VII secretion target
MADEVRADYEQLEQVATRFANQSEETQQMLEKVRSSMQQLEDGGWIGDAADDFFSEMHSLVLPASRRLQTALDEANRVTKDIVQTIQQAEEEASSRFRSD